MAHAAIWDPGYQQPECGIGDIGPKNIRETGYEVEKYVGYGKCEPIHVEGIVRKKTKNFNHMLSRALLGKCLLKINFHKHFNCLVYGLEKYVGYRM